MMKNPTVSVIIPTYNRAHLVGRAIQSVLNQTYNDFELIIVDDGSTDNIDDIIKDFQKKEKRIKYIRHEKNRGGSAARNTGIKASRGEYIAFLDSDDEWLKEKLKRQIKVFKNASSEVGVVYTGFLVIDERSNEIKRIFTPKKRGYIYKDLLFEVCVGTCSTLVIKKECFNQVGMFDEKLPAHQDWDLEIRISKYYKYNFIKTPLVKYYLHTIQISKNFNAKITSLYTVLEKNIKDVKKHRYIYCENYFKLSKLYLILGKTKESRKCLFRAIFIYPLSIIKKYKLIFRCLFGMKVCEKIRSIKGCLKNKNRKK